MSNEPVNNEIELNKDESLDEEIKEGFKEDAEKKADIPVEDISLEDVAALKEEMRKLKEKNAELAKSARSATPTKGRGRASARVSANRNADSSVDSNLAGKRLIAEGDQDLPREHSKIKIDRVALLGSSRVSSLKIASDALMSKLPTVFIDAMNDNKLSLAHADATVISHLEMYAEDKKIYVGSTSNDNIIASIMKAMSINRDYMPTFVTTDEEKKASEKTRAYYLWEARQYMMDALLASKNKNKTPELHVISDLREKFPGASPNDRFTKKLFAPVVKVVNQASCEQFGGKPYSIPSLLYNVEAQLLSLLEYHTFLKKCSKAKEAYNEEPADTQVLHSGQETLQELTEEVSAFYKPKNTRYFKKGSKF